MPEILCGCCGAKGEGWLCELCNLRLSDVVATRSEFRRVIRAVVRLSEMGVADSPHGRLFRYANGLVAEGFGFEDWLAVRLLERAKAGGHLARIRAHSCEDCGRRSLAFGDSWRECPVCLLDEHARRGGPQ